MENTTITIVFIRGYPQLPTTQTQTRGNKYSTAATAGQYATATLSHQDTDSGMPLSDWIYKRTARIGMISNLLYKANNLGS